MRTRNSIANPVNLAVVLAGVAFFVCAMLAGSSAGQIATEYPRLDVTPTNPAVGDSVTIKLVKGMASNSCMAPTYERLSHSIQLLDAHLYPPAFAVTISYVEVPVPPDRICPMIYAPVEYGPEYQLGQLREGTYIVRDGRTTVGTFTVTAEPVPPKRLRVSGTVMEDPGALDVIILLADVRVYLQVADFGPGPVPLGMPIPYTTVDSAVTDAFGRFSFAGVEAGSVQLVFVAREHQTQYLPMSLQVDTVLSVYLLPNDATGSVTGVVNEACPPGMYCLWLPPVPGCTVTVDILVGCVPKATGAPTQYSAVTDDQGRYTIRDIPISPGLAGQGCFTTYVVKAEKEGYASQTKHAELTYGYPVTVNFELLREGTAVASRAVGTKATSSVRHLPQKEAFELDLGRSQLVSVNVFTLEGRRIDDLSFSRFMATGTHTVKLGHDRGARGMMLIRLKSEDLDKSFRVNLSVAR